MDALTRFYLFCFIYRKQKEKRTRDIPVIYGIEFLRARKTGANNCSLNAPAIADSANVTSGVDWYNDGTLFFIGSVSPYKHLANY